MIIIGSPLCDCCLDSGNTNEPQLQPSKDKFYCFSNNNTNNHNLHIKGILILYHHLSLIGQKITRFGVYLDSIFLPCKSLQDGTSHYLKDLVIFLWCIVIGACLQNKEHRSIRIMCNVVFVSLKIFPIYNVRVLLEIIIQK